MSGMDDLVVWLRQQIDEDERAARAWLPFGNPTAADRTHPARHDPARVLAEVDAKRRLLDLHALMWRDISWLDTDEDGSRDEVYEELEVCGYCVRKHSSFAARADVPTGPCLTVRLLVLPYADRPGYQPEWAPSA